MSSWRPSTAIEYGEVLGVHPISDGVALHYDDGEFTRCTILKHSSGVARAKQLQIGERISLHRGPDGTVGKIRTVVSDVRRLLGHPFQARRNRPHYYEAARAFDAWGRGYDDLVNQIIAWESWDDNPQLRADIEAWCREINSCRMDADGLMHPNDMMLAMIEAAWAGNRQRLLEYRRIVEGWIIDQETRDAHEQLADTLLAAGPYLSKEVRRRAFEMAHPEKKPYRELDPRPTGPGD